ncbi:hypothetical protein AB0903_03235 [Streptomyces sp. NPDC048389]|uniref:hypothetical protein n=1 Tax=Streptomyces sp. NPDC048389 TaxID=3154622 RepID=UPI0034512E19
MPAAVGFGAAGAAALTLGTGEWGSGAALAAPPMKSDPFSLGVASGEPMPDGVVLRTHPAPDLYAPDGPGGMPAKPVRVHDESAHDKRFQVGRIAARPHGEEPGPCTDAVAASCTGPGSWDALCAGVVSPCRGS